MDMNFTFNSSDHIRYQFGMRVAGPFGSAHRAVKVEPNIEGGTGYTVTIYNLDGVHPVWQNNIQMAPKPMKVVDEQPGKVVLRGFGTDGFGNSFANYGLSIFTNPQGEVTKCVLHMHDRNIDIEYLK